MGVLAERVRRELDRLGSPLVTGVSSVTRIADGQVSIWFDTDPVLLLRVTVPAEEVIYLSAADLLQIASSPR